MRRFGLVCAACVMPTLYLANCLPRLFLHILCAASFLFCLFAVALYLRRPNLVLLYVSAWIFIASGLYTLCYEAVYQRAVRYDGREISATVEVTPASSDGVYVFRVVESKIGGETVKIPGRISSYIYGCDAEVFDRMEITARLSVCENVYSQRARGIYLEAQVEGISNIETPQTRPASAWIRDIQAYIKYTISDMVGGEEAGLAVSVLTGDTKLLSRGTVTDLSRSGLSHITSVSGMHLSILVGYLYLLISKLRHGRRTACVISLVFTLFIMAVAGFSPPVLRSGIMTFVLYIGYLIGRRSDSLNTLGVAAALIGLADPFSVVDVGFVLSVSATLGIVAGSPWLSGKINEWWDISPMGKRLLNSLCVTLCATLFTLPAMILYFSQISVVGPLSNLAANLPVTGLLICALFLCLFAKVPIIGTFFAVAARLCSDFIIRTADFFARLPWASVYIKSMPLMLWFAYVIIAAAIFLICRAFKYDIDLKMAAALCVVVLLCNLAAGAYLSKDRLYITSFDIGRADCHAAVYNGVSIVFDCGDAGAISLLADSLKAQGVYTINYLIITNYSDSYAAAADELFDHFGVESVYMPALGGGENREDILDAASGAGSSVNLVSEVAIIRQGDIFTKLYPYSEDSGDGLVANMYFGVFNMLYMSNATGMTERLLAAAIPYEMSADMLIVGHHGIKSTADSVFLSAVLPKIAVITSKDAAHTEVLDRLEGCGAAVYHTGLCGGISATVDGDGRFYTGERG